jgi:hypothetical protein
LGDLDAELFRDGDPAVATDDEGYYLSFTVPDELLRDGGGLHDAASVLLRRVNGVARTLGSDFRPVGLTGRFSDETGRQHHVILADSVEQRTRVNHVTLTVTTTVPPGGDGPRRKRRGRRGWGRPSRSCDWGRWPAAG